MVFHEWLKITSKPENSFIRGKNQCILYQRVRNQVKPGSCFDTGRSIVLFENKLEYENVRTRKTFITRGSMKLVQPLSGGVSCHEEILWRHRSLLEETFILLGLSKMEDWYGVRVSQLPDKTKTMLVRYGCSLAIALSVLYPEVSWQPWRFPKAPRGYWKVQANVQVYTLWLAEQLGVVRMEDWHHVNHAQIDQIGGSSPLRTFGGLYALLTRALNGTLRGPVLETTHARGPLRKGQRILLKLLQSLFPFEEVVVDYRHNVLPWSVELDVCIVDYAIAFEYQGVQHYVPHFLFGSPELQKVRDLEKSKFCERFGISLVEVPYWWDHRSNTLVTLIRTHRPDLLLSFECKLNMPTQSFNKIVLDSVSHQSKLPFDLVRSQLAPIENSILGCSSDEIVDGCWASELFQGPRVLWNGRDKFFPESGEHHFEPPESWLHILPQVPLDGQLYCKHDNMLIPPNGEKILSSWMLAKHLLKHYFQCKSTTFRVYDLVHSQIRLEDRRELLMTLSSNSSNGSLRMELAELWKTKGKFDLRRDLALSPRGIQTRRVLLKRPHSFYHDRASVLSFDLATL